MRLMKFCRKLNSRGFLSLTVFRRQVNNFSFQHLPGTEQEEGKGEGGGERVLHSKQTQGRE